MAEKPLFLTAIASFHSIMNYSEKGSIIKPFSKGGRDFPENPGKPASTNTNFFMDVL